MHRDPFRARAVVARSSSAAISESVALLLDRVLRATPSLSTATTDDDDDHHHG